MTEDDVIRAFEALSEKIEALPVTRRQECQAELHALIEKAEALGVKLPSVARDLDDELTEAAIEAQFDNMPV
ncbi:hypothetical protein RXV86_17060 [Alisedimentitalea sp. MJ-SS2]|uniref:hypothetical protein n=1 Tax=Aliisedimentitalea sp. MJ-SS2 TaxID=3049795 RepID=UPI00290C1483|nr:hypothetical protein [Alisedimentitalea sp. MJ-SS2]MDU8929106.1 hypothetical protein [Alisedimentitalea sp. MJ-SS2]